MKVKDFYELSVPLILDGGSATELETTHGKDLSTKLWSAACLYQDPDAIREVHLSYLRAGADIVSTCRLDVVCVNLCILYVHCVCVYFIKDLLLFE